MENVKENQNNLHPDNKEFIENITPVASVSTKEKYYLSTVYEDVVYDNDDNLELVAARYILRNVKTHEMKEASKEDLVNFEIVSKDDENDIDDEFTITRDDRYVDVEVSSFSNAFPVIEDKSPLDIQTEGDYYKQGSIQPIEYIHANKMGYVEGCIVKYITRYKFKNDGKDAVKDLKKIKHYVDLLLKLEYGQDNNH